MITKAKKPAAKTTKSAPKAAAPAVASDVNAKKVHRREIKGIIVSDKMTKTVVVKVDRQIRHGLYNKYLVRSCKYKAHDENNEAKMGDLVTISECRPLSKDKRWRVKEIVRRAAQIGSLQVT